MKRRMRAWIAPIVMAGLTIWATGVTFGGLEAEEGGDPSMRCIEDPFSCEHFGGTCYGHCIKDLFPDEATCCWIEVPEP